MAKIKLTKTELKAQTDALKRFQRFLPMLQLKKQQLQGEIAGITQKAEETSAKEREVRADLDRRRIWLSPSTRGRLVPWAPRRPWMCSMRRF